MQADGTTAANRKRGLAVSAKGTAIAREVMGESAIQLQANIRKVGTRHASSKGAPEFGHEIFVDFMPAIP